MYRTKLWPGKALMEKRKPKTFHSIARDKGWTLMEIGKRWGVGERQMSRVANSASQKDIDAVNGLPKK